MSYNRNYVRGSYKHKKGPSSLIPILVIAIGIIAAAGFLVYSLFFGQDSSEEIAGQMPNMEEINFFDYHGNGHLTAGRMYATINGEIITSHYAPTFIEGRLYFPADFLRAHIDRYIFWEQNSSRLTITNIDEVMRFSPNDETYTINWQPQPLTDPIREVSGMAYMSADMVMERYSVTIMHQEEYGFIILDLPYYERHIYEIIEIVEEDEINEEYTEQSGENEDSFVPMRFGPSDQHPIMARLHPGDRVVNFGAAQDEEENDDIFLRIQAENGLIGYVAAANLDSVEYIPAVTRLEMRRLITRTLDEPINLAYHLMNVNNPDTWYAPQGVNVLSPMWFRFDPEARNGDIISWARHDYVQWAHRNGIEVWPAIMDMFEGGNFSNEVAQLVLLDAEIRDHVIAQLMQLIETYNLDGINIDYEQVRAPESEHWIQFLRELAVPMRQSGAILSVAAKVPIPDNMFWNRTEIGLASDFIVIMAYDEHWSSSPIAGPVASFNFVADGVQNTLNEVPPHQVVVALPTYVNIWREEFVDGEWQLVFNLRRETPRQVGMPLAYDIVTSQGGEFVWDYITRQYYAEIEIVDDGLEIRYRVWLEDLRSMREKLALVRQHNLAGVGFWQKGLELPALWAEVYATLN